MGVDVLSAPRFDRPLEATVREARLLDGAPWIRSLGGLELRVTTEGWRRYIQVRRFSARGAVNALPESSSA